MANQRSIGPERVRRLVYYLCGKSALVNGNILWDIPANTYIVLLVEVCVPFLIRALIAMKLIKVFFQG